MLESGIEASFGRKIQEWAQDNLPAGWDLAYVKFTGAKGWPDRQLIWGHFDQPARYIWVEWKQPGEKLRPLQAHIHKQLRAMGADVRTYDDYRLALDEIKTEITAAIRATAGHEPDSPEQRLALVSAARKGENRDRT